MARAKTDRAKLADDLTRKAGEIVRGIDKLANINGGKAYWHEQAERSLGDLLDALSQMREGKA